MPRSIPPLSPLPQTQSPTRSIPSLDGWRAVAASVVVLSHLVPVGHAWNSGVGIGGSWTQSPVLIGPMGVRIFFVLSGYLISRLLLAEREKTGRISLGMFYLRRSFRIAPPLVVYLAVIGVLAALGWVPETRAGLLRAAGYVSNYGSGNAWVTSHTWSLSVEEQFYVLWPIALVVGGRRAWITPVIVLAIVPLLRFIEYGDYTLTETWAVEQHFETVSDALATGVCLAYATDWLRDRSWYSRWQASPLPWLLIPLTYAALAMGRHPKLFLIATIPVANVAIALLIDWSVRRPDLALGRLLNLAPLRWFGRLSYSLYLWQQLAVADAPGRTLLRLSSPLTLFTTLPGVVLTILGLGVVSYYGIEQPVLRARSRLERWVARRRRVSEPDAQPPLVPAPAVFCRDVRHVEEPAALVGGL